jgi:acetyltransferase-like isoleucine patch superfamily enzyme
MKEFIAAIRGYLLILSCKIKRRNVTIGTGFKIYNRVSILGDGEVVIGKNCHIDGMIGSNNFVCIQTFNPLAVIKIGDNVHLHAARIAAKFSVVIGNDVIIEDTNIVDTDFHTLDRSRVMPLDEGLMKNRIIIGNRVGIGAQSFITKGVVIGDGALIAPCSVVAKSVKSGCFAYGNPLISKESYQSHE